MKPEVSYPERPGGADASQPHPVAAAPQARDVTLNGRRFDDGDARAPHLLKLLASRSTRIDDYRPLLQGMADGAEYTVLAEMLLDSECRHAFEHGTAMIQGDGEIALCRDSCKTVLISPAHRLLPRAGATCDATIDVYANDMLFVVLGEGRLLLDHHRVVEASAESGARASIVPCGRRAYARYDAFELRAGRDAIDIAAVQGQPWLLQLVTSMHDPVARHFDRRSGTLAGVSSANFHASRLEFVLDLFKRFGYAEAADSVAAIHGGSRFHFVRWKAVQTMLHLDYERGVAMLRQSVSDPHPQIRDAAERTLANLARAAQTQE
jgi:hypothetical protein